MTQDETAASNFWNPWRIGGWSLAGGLLLLPAVAMRYSGEVRWTAGDFLLASMMFGILGLGIELAVRSTRNRYYRAGTAVALLAGFLVTWINGAVGIIGNEDNPANLLFFGVIALAIAGSFLARFKAAGIARTLAGAALAQFAVPLFAIAIWSSPLDAGLIKTLLFNGVLAAVWLLSAWLFQRAKRVNVTY